MNSYTNCNIAIQHNSAQKWTDGTCNNIMNLKIIMGLPRWSNGKESTHQPGDARDADLIPGLGREGNGNLLHCSCLENSMDRRAWWVTVHGVTKSQTWLKQLSIIHTNDILSLQHIFSLLLLKFSLKVSGGREWKGKNQSLIFCYLIALWLWEVWQLLWALVTSSVKQIFTMLFVNSNI